MIRCSVAAVALVVLPSCDVVTTFFPAGTSIVLPFTRAVPAHDTFGQRFVQYLIENRYAPLPTSGFERTTGRGFAIFEPSPGADGLWRFQRAQAAKTPAERRLPPLEMPSALYAPLKRLGIAAWLRKDGNAVFDVVSFGPGPEELDLLARYGCAELALKALVTKTGRAGYAGLMPLTKAPQGPACVARGDQAREGLL